MRSNLFINLLSDEQDGRDTDAVIDKKKDDDDQKQNKESKDSDKEKTKDEDQSESDDTNASSDDDADTNENAAPNDADLTSDDSLSDLDDPVDSDSTIDNDDPQDEIEDQEPIDVNLDDLETYKQAEKDQAKVTEEDKKKVEGVLQDIQENQDDIKVVTQAAESYVQVVNHQRLDTGAEIELLMRIRKKHGLKNFNSALENLSADEQSKIAQEGFKETIKAIFAKIIAFIQKAIEYVKNVIKNLFDNNRILMSNISKVNSAILQMDKERGKDLDTYFSNQGIDLARYVKNEPEAKKFLTYAGKFLDEITIHEGQHQTNRRLSAPQMLDRSLMLVNGYQKFIGGDLGKSIEALEKLIEGLETLTIVKECKIDSVDVVSLLPTEPVQVFAVENKICPQGYEWFLCDGFLGDLYVICQKIQGDHRGDFQTNLEALTHWMQFTAVSNQEFNHNDLPRLEARDIQACTTVVSKIGNVVGDLSHDVEKYEKMVSLIEKACKLLNTKIEHTSSKLTQTDVFKNKIYSELLHFCSNWMVSAKAAFDTSVGHGKNVQAAWFKYLLSLYRTDTANLKTLNSLKK